MLTFALTLPEESRFAALAAVEDMLPFPTKYDSLVAAYFDTLDDGTFSDRSFGDVEGPDGFVRAFDLTRDDLLALRLMDGTTFSDEETAAGLVAIVQADSYGFVGATILPLGSAMVTLDLMELAYDAWTDPDEDTF